MCLNNTKLLEIYEFMKTWTTDTYLVKGCNIKKVKVQDKQII